MSQIELVLPNKSHEMIIEEWKQEHFDNNEFTLHGSSGLDKTETYDLWLKHLKNNSKKETTEPNCVVATTFFGIRKTDNKIIGMIDIRHELNEFLLNYGGNIGYGVRPSERKKGYATEMLELALEYCRKIKLEKVLICCNKDNPASRKTILNFGGILEKEFLYSDGHIVQKFWIEL